MNFGTLISKTILQILHIYFYNTLYMTTSLFPRKIISSFLLTSFVVMASPISAIYAAAVIAEVTPIPTPSNNSTPSYTFSSDAVGSINYTGLCSSSYLNTVVGNNTITPSNARVISMNLLVKFIS